MSTAVAGELDLRPGSRSGADVWSRAVRAQALEESICAGKESGGQSSGSLDCQRSLEGDEHEGSRHCTDRSRVRGACGRHDSPGRAQRRGLSQRPEERRLPLPPRRKRLARFDPRPPPGPAASAGGHRPCLCQLLGSASRWGGARPSRRSGLRIAPRQGQRWRRLRVASQVRNPFEACPACLLTETSSRLWTLYEGRELFPALSSTCTAVRFALLPASACSEKAAVPALPAKEPVKGLSPLALALALISSPWIWAQEPPGLLFPGGRRRRFGR